MLYQLPDGRTVEMSLEDYLSFTDLELHQLQGNTYYGDQINNPYYGSIINKPGKPEKKTSVTETSNHDKRHDKDFHRDDI